MTSRQDARDAPSPAAAPELRQPWSLSMAEAAEGLGVDPAHGLSDAEAAKRRRRHGPNLLARATRTPLWRIAWNQIANIIVLLLLAAGALAMLFGQWLEGVAICAALLVNVVIGFVTELKAVRSIEALREMSRGTAKVRRDGEARVLPGEELVPGDVVLLESGDIVPADLRLLEANRMQADEAALTGESLPVAKSVAPLAPDTALADRSNMAFKGTALSTGSGEGLVTATGMATELGRIATLAEQAGTEDDTPLEQRLNRLGQRLIWVCLGIGAVVAGVGYWAGKDPYAIVETAIALAIAAIPEGLPIVATMAMAKGVWRMHAKQALINRLAAVQTLGATSVIFTDKTGTLTENHMHLAELAGCLESGDPSAAVVREGEALSREDESWDSPRLVLDHGRGRALTADEVRANPVLFEALRAGVLCSNAHLGDLHDPDDDVGEPMEVALLEAGALAGLHRAELVAELPEVREEAFDNETNMMATFHQDKDADDFLVAVKGAPASVLAAADSVAIPDGIVAMDEECRQQWAALNDELAGRGLRVLAVAQKRADSDETDPYHNLTLLALLGLHDPPRKEIRGAIETLGKAGIRVVMVTGDHPGTARAIARAVGMVADDDEARAVAGSELDAVCAFDGSHCPELAGISIFARVSPEQKLQIIDAFQRNNQVVAMTGDGVNDAPALKKADIGVAMGQRGTQVAKEAADMVLRDDRFTTIVDAVEEGRIIFKNIRRFIIYLLSGNVSQILIVVGAILLSWPLPLLPLQILFINMLSDVFPALALGVGGAHGEDVLREPPRPASESIITGAHWTAILVYGVLLAASVLTAFWAGLFRLGLEPEPAATVAFTTLALARTWHTFNMRDVGANPFVNNVTRNPWVWGAVVLSLGLLALALYQPVLRQALAVHLPPHQAWPWIVGASLAPVAVIQTAKSLLPLLGMRRSGDRTL